MLELEPSPSIVAIRLICSFSRSSVSTSLAEARRREAIAIVEPSASWTLTGPSPGFSIKPTIVRATAIFDSSSEIRTVWSSTTTIRRVLARVRRTTNASLGLTLWRLKSAVDVDSSAEARLADRAKQTTGTRNRRIVSIAVLLSVVKVSASPFEFTNPAPGTSKGASCTMSPLRQQSIPVLNGGVDALEPILPVHHPRGAERRRGDQPSAHGARGSHQEGRGRHLHLPAVRLAQPAEA